MKKIKNVKIHDFSINDLNGHLCYEANIEIGNKKIYLYPYTEFFNNTNFRLHIFITIISDYDTSSSIWEKLDEMSIEQGIKHLKLK